MNTILLVSCILVAGANTFEKTVEIWKEMARKRGEAEVNETVADEDGKAQAFFNAYWKSRERSGEKVPTIQNPVHAVLGTFTKIIYGASYHEVIARFNATQPTDSRLEGYVYGPAAAAGSSTLFEEKLKYGVDEFIFYNKKKLPAQLRGVRIDYDVINIGPVGQPEKHLYAQLYAVA